MSKVHLRSIAESRRELADKYLFGLRRLVDLAKIDTFKRYTLTENPAEADFILFVESMAWDSPSGLYFEGVRRDPIYRRYRDKSLIYSGLDWPVPFVPGIFPSAEKSWNLRSRARGGCYIEGSNPYISFSAQPALAYEPHYLASFVGCLSGEEVRRRVLALDDPAMYLVDNTEGFLKAARTGAEEKLNRFKWEYVDSMRRSKFVLCPRGFGASSIRLFETMEMGRVPVIVSDQWTEPKGPSWASFSLKVKERDIERIPSILRAAETIAESWGQRAREAWERWYSPEVLFHRICETCTDLLASRWCREAFTRPICYVHFLHPRHTKRLIGKWKSLLAHRLLGE